MWYHSIILFNSIVEPCCSDFLSCSLIGMVATDKDDRPKNPITIHNAKSYTSIEALETDMCGPSPASNEIVVS